MRKKTIDRVNVDGKRVLMRVDFNVPLNEDGTIADDRRIEASIPSIRSVIDRGGKLILMSHLGRPGGEGHEPRYSLEPVAKRLGEILGTSVLIPGPDPVGAAVDQAVERMKDGDVILLENLRFHPGEKDNDAGFSRALAGLGEIYCNDAFGTSHREDASMVGVPRAMHERNRPRVAGLLLKKEIEFLTDALANPAKPFVAVLGGAKVADKLGVIRHLMDRVDSILVGGAMAYTFLKALGKNVGDSLVEEARLGDAKAAINEAAGSATDLHLPEDHVVGKALAPTTPNKVVKSDIPAGWMGLDIGPETAAKYGRIIRGAKTIVWNGPVGAFETKPFDVGSRQVAREIAHATVEEGAVSIVGGGDTAAAVEEFGLEDRFTHVSTGGGASLALLQGRRLESIELLDPA